MAKKIEYATTAEIKVGDIIQARLDGRAIKVENIETATEKDGTTSRIFLGKTCLKDGMPSKVNLHRYIHESNVMKVNGRRCDDEGETSKEDSAPAARERPAAPQDKPLLDSPMGQIQPMRPPMQLGSADVGQQRGCKNPKGGKPCKPLGEKEI